MSIQKSQIPVRRNIFFDLILLLLFLALLEFSATIIMKRLYFQDDLRSDMHPILRFDEDLGYRVRSDLFNADTHKFLVTSKSGNSFLGVISFDKKEGMIRTEQGDLILNRWGFRGPDFENERPPETLRIITLGGSTTAGGYENELTYPRILERMLNFSKNPSQYFQVINAGRWSYTSCDVKVLFERDILSFRPDVVLVMAGGNDAYLLNNPNILNQQDYCYKPNSVLDRFAFYRLFKKKFSPINEAPKMNFEILDKNLGFYKENLRKIVELGQTHNIQVGFVSPPAVYENGVALENLQEFPQLSKMDKTKINYFKKIGLAFNNTMQELASAHKNAFFIDSGISAKTRGKELFFHDDSHANGEGYRVIAYEIYKTLNQKMNLQRPIKPPYEFSKVSPNQLEVEYLKSLFSSYGMEDLSYAGCVTFHNKCTDFEFPGEDRLYTLSVISFTIGSLLLFEEQIEEVGNLLESSIENAIKIKPNFSLLYWVKGELMKALGKQKLSEISFKEAYQLNPALQEISFKEQYRKFRKGYRPNPFMISLKRIIEILKRSPNHIAPYTYFRSLRQKGLNKENLPKNLELYISLYYTSPLLIRSIFEEAINSPLSKEGKETALSLARSLKTMRLEYGFDKIFTDHENQILKNE